MRYNALDILADLEKKMVFLGGPRQCGKTTLAKKLMGQFSHPIYFNWDQDADRRATLKYDWPDAADLIIYDELHKFPRWKNWVKGCYDTRPEHRKILVTGSARLDVYRRGGDSLLGRYHYWRLHPFTLSELPAKISMKEGFRRLLEFGGFPEPFLDANEREARRWRKERFDRVLRDDVRDLEKLRDIQSLGLLVDLLRTRVGSPIVVKNLAEDLQVSQPTVKHWLEVLEKMYIIFLVRPYSKNIARALLKPPKAYFFDNADVLGDEGARFENLVATHLLKSMHYLEDRDGHRLELRYIRDKEGNEVDFALLKNDRVVELVEAKWQSGQVHPGLKRFAEKLNVPAATQIVGMSQSGYQINRLKIRPAVEDLAALERPSLT